MAVHYWTHHLAPILQDDPTKKGFGKFIRRRASPDGYDPMISNGFGGTLFSDKRIRHTFQRVDGWGLNHRGQLTADCRLHKRCMGARHAHVSCLVFFGLTWRKISVKQRAIYAKQTHQHLQYLYARETSTTGNGRKLHNFRRIFTYGLFQLKICKHLQRPGGINLVTHKVWPEKNRVCRVCIHLANDKNVCDMS